MDTSVEWQLITRYAVQYLVGASCHSFHGVNETIKLNVAIIGEHLLGRHVNLSTSRLVSGQSAQGTSWLGKGTSWLGAKLTALPPSLGTKCRQTEPRHWQEPPVFSLSVSAMHNTVECSIALSCTRIEDGRTQWVIDPVVTWVGLTHAADDETPGEGKRWLAGGVSALQPGGPSLRLNHVILEVPMFKCSNNQMFKCSNVLG